MNSNIIEKANIIVNAAEDAYIGVIDENSYPSVSTLSRIKSDGIYEAYFSTGMSGTKTQRILKNNKVSVCFRDGGSNVTLVGEAEILTDQSTKHSLWQDWFIEHFSEGKDDPEYCIIKFTSKRVSLWIDGESAGFTIGEVECVQSCCGLLCNSCTYKEPCNCGGCIETKGHPFHGECSIAVCCQNKGYTHCGECADMPCEPLHAYSCLDKEHGDNPCGARLNILKHWSKVN